MTDAPAIRREKRRQFNQVNAGNGLEKAAKFPEMSHVGTNHVEILRRVNAGRRLRGGMLATVQDEIDRLVALRLIEPSGGFGRYRLTPAGAVVLAAIEGKAKPLPSISAI